MEAFPVSKMVNSPANESAKCIDPQAESEAPVPRPPKPTKSKKKRQDPDSGGLFA
jgi:hypothetical protein